MGETTQEERDRARGNWLPEGFYWRLFNDADRLAAIERQVLWRTEDMPESAIGWYKGESGIPTFVYQIDTELAEDTGLAEGVQTIGPVAPDYRPNEPGPLFLPILDPPT